MKKCRNKSILLIPVCVAVISFTLFVLGVWNGWLGLPYGKIGRGFCEASDGLIKQPVNTWSNFGFIAAGLAIAWLMWKNAFSENRNTFTLTSFTPIFFSSLVILVGPCSMAMHATLSRVGGALDMFSMFLICGFLMAYSLQRFFGWKPLYFTIVFVLVTAVGEWAATYRHHFHLISGRNAFLFFIAVTVIFETLNSFVRKLKHEIKWLIYGLLTFLVALTFWNLWKTNSPLCNPHSLMQGHAVWHLLDALSLFFLFRFYVSEHRAELAPSF
ncbi:MAG: ceramidase domain-containing protein [Verrucomicrobiota bacterium]